VHPCGHQLCIIGVAFGLCDRPAAQTLGDDLDPSLEHRLEPLSLLLRILVWDGADEVVAPAVLSILLGCHSMMILSTRLAARKTVVF
jgi:hypothetical protein